MKINKLKHALYVWPLIELSIITFKCAYYRMIWCNLNSAWLYQAIHVYLSDLITIILSVASQQGLRRTDRNQSTEVLIDRSIIPMFREFWIYVGIYKKTDIMAHHKWIYI